MTRDPKSKKRSQGSRERRAADRCLPPSPRDDELRTPAQPGSVRRRPAGHRTGLAYLVLAAALLAGTMLRVKSIAGKRTLIPDEAISYLVATGHKGEFHRIVDNQTPPLEHVGEGG